MSDPVLEALSRFVHLVGFPLVDRLTERGFIQRCRGEGDQRWVFVTLTSQGEEALRNLSLAHRAELQSTGPALVQALTLLLSKNNS
jgi:DNA-binding MarR family transcriptional regulator